MGQLRIDLLEAYLRDHYGTEASEQGLFMKLVEEVGEVAELLNKRSGLKAENGEDLSARLSEELADIIHYTVALAAINQLDLTTAILEKDKTASIRYKHRINLEQFLKETN